MSVSLSLPAASPPGPLILKARQALASAGELPGVAALQLCTQRPDAMGVTSLAWVLAPVDLANGAWELGQGSAGTGIGAGMPVLTSGTGSAPQVLQVRVVLKSFFWISGINSGPEAWPSPASFHVLA